MRCHGRATEQRGRRGSWAAWTGRGAGRRWRTGEGGDETGRRCGSQGRRWTWRLRRPVAELGVAAPWRFGHGEEARAVEVGDDPFWPEARPWAVLAVPDDVGVAGRRLGIGGSCFRAPGGSLVRVPEDREGEIMRGRRPQRGKRKREGARGREEICSGELAYRGGGDQALDRGRGTPRSREREEREALCWLVGHGRRGRSGAAGWWMDASGGSQGGRGVAAGRRIGWDSPPRI